MAPGEVAVLSHRMSEVERAVNELRGELRTTGPAMANLATQLAVMSERLDGVRAERTPADRAATVVGAGGGFAGVLAAVWAAVQAWAQRGGG